MAVDNKYTVIQDFEIPNDWSMTLTTIDASNNYLYIKDGKDQELVIKLKSIHPATSSEYSTRLALKTSGNVNCISYITHSDGTETFKILQMDPIYKINTALISVQERSYDGGIGG